MTDHHCTCWNITTASAPTAMIDEIWNLERLSARRLVVQFRDLQFYDMAISVSVGRDIPDQDHG